MRPHGTRTSAFGSSRRENHDSSAFYSRRLYQETKNRQVSGYSSVENKIPEEYLDHVITQSSRKMSFLPDSRVHLMVTSPPYNVGKEYDKNLSLHSYDRLISDVLKETFRVLVLGGRICVNITNVGRRPYIPLHKRFIDIAARAGFLMRGEIIWNKGAGSGASTAWGSWKSASNPTLRDVHEYILVFSKGEFGRERGKKKNSINEDEFLEYTKSVWDFKPESAKRVGHPAPFPVELPYRCIQLYSFTEDVILDPFCGVGATCVAAKISGRHYVGIDNNASYVKAAVKRLESVHAEMKD